MIRSIEAALVLVILLTIITSGAKAEQVAMSGEYGVSSGRTVNFPINPPRLPCTNIRNARCHQGGANGNLDPLVEPASGVSVAGAGVVIMPGGLDACDAFPIPPLVFKQGGAGEHNFTPVVNNVAIVQLDTTLTLAMPAAQRAFNPPPNTRRFEPNAWSQPGNGQTGRVAADTTPISTGTQNVHDITLRYIAGPLAFGGTMANLLDGEGSMYASPPVLTSSSSYNPESRPWVGLIRFGDGVQGNLQTRNGAGWGYTRMGSNAPGIVRNLCGIAPPCTQQNPPGPPGCGLVTDFTGFTIGTIPGGTSTRWVHAYTTGTVLALLTGTLGGFPNNQLLTAMGYDTTSATPGVRNIGMVAGSYTLRNSPSGAQGGHQIIGVDMSFTPEPAPTAGLIGAIGFLAFLARSRRR